MLIIVSVNLAGGILEVGNYAVIADNPEQFLIDYPDYEGLLFDSAFSLNNSGETISITDDTVTYSSEIGANGDGNSLQLSGDIFISASPTPGEENSNTATNPDNSSEESSDKELDISSHSGSTVISSEDPVREIKIGAGRDRITIVKAPIEFDAVHDNSSGPHVKFVWNMGDGKTERGRKIDHVYKYPGIYSVVLHARSAGNYAVSRTKVHVLENNLELVFEDDFLILKNNSNFEVNVGEFKISSNDVKFIFPKDTIILENSRIVIDKDMANFSNSNLVELKTPSGHIMSSVKNDIFYSLTATSKK